MYKAYNDLKLLLVFQDIENKNIIRIIDIDALQNSLRLLETHLSYSFVVFCHQS